MVLYLLPSFLWIALHRLIKRVMNLDFQLGLEGWLEDATLFSNEHLEPAINFDIIDTDNGKAKNHEALLDIPSISNIWGEEGWMDEKIDLSILDCQNEWLPPPNDSERLMIEEAALILDTLIDADFDSSDFLHIATSTDAEKYLKDSENLSPSENLYCPPENNATSPENMPVFLPKSYSNYSISSVSSPSSSSEGNTSECSLSAVYDSDSSIKSSEQLHKKLQIKNLKPVKGASNGIGKGQPSSRGKDMPSLRISMKTESHPYAVASHTKKQVRRERKKVQNKEAAARYRIKKRVEDQILSDEVASLESEQKKLQNKHDQLKNELTYLKSLMKEMFKARGLLK